MKEFRDDPPWTAFVPNLILNLIKVQWTCRLVEHLWQEINGIILFLCILWTRKRKLFPFIWLFCLIYTFASSLTNLLRYEVDPSAMGHPSNLNQSARKICHTSFDTSCFKVNATCSKSGVTNNRYATTTINRTGCSVILVWPGVHQSQINRTVQQNKIFGK